MHGREWCRTLTQDSTWLERHPPERGRAARRGRVRRGFPHGPGRRSTAPRVNDLSAEFADRFSVASMSETEKYGSDTRSPGPVLRGRSPSAGPSPRGPSPLSDLMRRCLQGRHRRPASQRGVRSFRIVEPDPTAKSREASGVRPVEADIGPLLQKGTVEPFDLAVHLGAAKRRQDMTKWIPSRWAATIGVSTRAVDRSQETVASVGGRGSDGSGDEVGFGDDAPPVRDVGLAAQPEVATMIARRTSCRLNLIS